LQRANESKIEKLKEQIQLLEEENKSLKDKITDDQMKQKLLKIERF
jgi:hypothetical protein